MQVNEDKEHVEGSSESPLNALPTSVLFANRPIRGSRCEYFTGPTSSDEFGWRTMPMLLRRVADWMDSVDLQDPELDYLTTKVKFTEGDEFYQTLSVYYRNNEDASTERETETTS